MTNTPQFDDLSYTLSVHEHHGQTVTHADILIYSN
jgi:hypothetical protein